jgi:hypothetical protein
LLGLAIVAIVTEALDVLGIVGSAFGQGDHVIAHGPQYEATFVQTEPTPGILYTHGTTPGL